MKRSRGSNMLALVLTLLSLCARPLLSQTVEVLADEQQVVVRKAACPTHLTGGFLGNWFGYRHAGYEWTDDWQRDRVLDPDSLSLAEYVPLGNPYDITSRDGRARWYEPRFLARCTATEFWFLGRIQAVDYATQPIRHYGRVVPIDEGSGEDCGGDGRNPETDHALTNDPMQSTYDPYLPADEGGCGGGDEGGEGSGIQYQPGDYTGGETVSWESGTGNGGQSVCGDQAKVEYICIERYNGETGQWEEWSCGYATTC